MASLENVRIGIIGAGAIGGAVIDRLIIGAGAKPDDIIACETDESKRNGIARRFGVRTTSDAADAAESDLIVIAVPPPVVPEILSSIHNSLAHHPVVISFAAALPLAFLESGAPGGTPVVRVNPNSPSLVGEGFNPVVYGSSVTGDARKLADRFLGVLGTSDEVPDEQMNLYTALTAVGPTYFLPVFDAIIAAGIEGGLTREAAVAAASETARGTAMMVAGREEDPEELKLYTGLRPLKDAEVRDFVRAAIDDAFERMKGVQAKVTGS